jgi:hypothetical protein
VSSFAFVEGTLAVTPATLTVNPDNRTRTYGAANPPLTGVVVGLRNADPVTVVYGTAAQPGSDVGTYPITAALSGDRLKNYQATANTGTLTVTPASLTVQGADATRLYGDSNPALAAGYSGFVLGQDASLLSGSLRFDTPATAASDVGLYPITPSGLTSTNYALRFASGTLSVQPAPLLILPAKQSRVYGAPNPSLTGAISGIRNGDTVTASYGTIADLRSSAGRYDITVTSVSGGRLGNYQVTTGVGHLAVTPAPLTVQVDDQATSFGAPPPALTAGYRGFVNGDTASGVSGAPTLSSTATVGSPVGTYPITVVDAGTLSATNYFFPADHFVNGSLSVTLPSGSAFILHPTASGAVTASGNGSLSLPGALWVDSSATSAILASGNAHISAAGGVLVVGGVSRSGNASVTKTGTPLATTDPLASLPLPSLTGLPNYGAVSVAGNAMRMLSSGIYTSIQVSGNAVVTMNPGTYVILGGGLTVSGKGSLSGIGVLVFNAGSGYNGTSDGGTFGSISLGGSGTITLSPPTSGPYAGIVLFQSRSSTRAIAVSGNAAAGITGTIYAPAAATGLSGNAQLTATLVVATLSLTGNSGAYQLQSEASSDYVCSTSNWIANGILTVAVQDDTGERLDPNAVARLGDAI